MEVMLFVQTDIQPAWDERSAKPTDTVKLSQPLCTEIRRHVWVNFDVHNVYPKIRVEVHS